MSKLKINRERLNLTQEELSDQSGISVRTIQRIESGNEPKGQTLKILAKTLGVGENELLEKEEAQVNFDGTFYKIMNISSLPFTIIPPINIVIPLVIMFAKKRFNPLAKEIISIQILWLIFAAIIFMVSCFIRNWYSLGRKFIPVIMILLVLINVVIILRNSIEIDKRGKLFFKLNFSLI